jgi:heme-degrading monooxygenase HmoA
VILEHAILDVKKGDEARFEAAMREAQPLIRATPGFESIEVRPCIEKPGRYLLLVRWRQSRITPTAFAWTTTRAGEPAPVL